METPNSKQTEKEQCTSPLVLLYIKKGKPFLAARPFLLEQPLLGLEVFRDCMLYLNYPCHTFFPDFISLHAPVIYLLTVPYMFPFEKS